jgi:hypothetical protein
VAIVVREGRICCLRRPLKEASSSDEEKVDEKQGREFTSVVAMAMAMVRK